MDDKHCRIYTISAPTQALASASTSRSDSSDPQILPPSKRGRKRIRPVRRKTKATNTLRKVLGLCPSCLQLELVSHWACAGGERSDIG